MTKDIFLIHGGLYEGMNARTFWIDTGVVHALARLGFSVYAPDRVKAPGSWEEEANHLAGEMDRIHSVHILAASNGCSAAARMAVDKPNKIRSIIFCWPATAGDPQIDAATRRTMIEAGCSPQSVKALLSGEILRGMKAQELAAVSMPVGIIAPDPPDLSHQRKTIDFLLHTLPNAIELDAFPHPFADGFQESLPDFCQAIARFIEGKFNVGDP